MATGTIEATLSRSATVARTQLARAEGAAVDIDQQLTSTSELRSNAEALAAVGERLTRLLAPRARKD
jgi:hypothetical protein